MNNGDKVKYRMGLTFTYIGKNPIKSGDSFCIHPNGSIDSLPTEDLTPLIKDKLEGYIANSDYLIDEIMFNKNYTDYYTKQIPKPIGDFIINNAKGTQLEDGIYYHYTEVIKLLKKYRDER